ncbi:CGNR zinc finger domain-containing protein [Streptomyces sp. NPDC051664]|uniref:CGNR zinc finger domain-containing protein n=1 Tax=Streptomyces sp. NPDC051664 TaxID=3365668 RepID=UPI0037AA5D30
MELFAGPFARRIRECDAHDCQLLFIDTSRAGGRRWCAMARCGKGAPRPSSRRGRVSRRGSPGTPAPPADGPDRCPRRPTPSAVRYLRAGQPVATTASTAPPSRTGAP